jgi:hypothetical protein
LPQGESRFARNYVRLTMTTRTKPPRIFAGDNNPFGGTRSGLMSPCNARRKPNFSTGGDPTVGHELRLAGLTGTGIANRPPSWLTIVSWAPESQTPACGTQTGVFATRWAVISLVIIRALRDLRSLRLRG